jgi:hypothetical protein
MRQTPLFSDSLRRSRESASIYTSRERPLGTPRKFEVKTGAASRHPVDRLRSVAEGGKRSQQNAIAWHVQRPFVPVQPATPSFERDEMSSRASGPEVNRELQRPAASKASARRACRVFISDSRCRVEPLAGVVFNRSHHPPCRASRATSPERALASHRPGPSHSSRNVRWLTSAKPRGTRLVSELSDTRERRSTRAVSQTRPS